MPFQRPTRYLPQPMPQMMYLPASNEVSEFPAPFDHMGWLKEIQTLLGAMKKSFTKMGSIAYADNYEIGKNITCILQEQYNSGTLIESNFYHDYISSSGRVKGNQILMVKIPMNKMVMGGYGQMSR